MGSKEGAPSAPGLTLRKINVKRKVSESTLPAATEEEPVTPAGRLFMEPGMNCHILCALAFLNPIDVAEIKQTLLVTLVNHKRFQSVIRKDNKGKDVWVPVQVNIDAHIIEPTIDMSAPRFMEDYLTELALADPLDITRPMWQCHIINSPAGEPSKPAGHMVLRAHHALGDGTSLMSLLLACTRRLGHPDELPAVPVSKPKPQSRASLFTRAVEFLAVLWNTVVGVFLFTSTAIWLKDSDTVIKGHVGVENEKKKIAMETVDMSDFITVKNAVNATINDVLMAVVGEALLHYLQGRYAASSPTKSGGAVETTETGSEIEAEARKKILSKVEKFRIRACALMNTRGSPGLQEMASMMEGGSQHRWGNHLGYLLMNIPLKDHSDPLDYVRVVKKAIDKKKASLEGVFTYLSGAALMNLTGPIPPCILTRRVLLQTTMAISNVPGPTEAVTFGGNPILAIYPMVSGHPQSVSLYLQSYNGKASLVIMSAESAIPDPEVLTQLCLDSLKGMVKAAEACRGSS